MSEYLTGVLTIICINVVATTGLAVFTGFTGLFSLGHAAFVAIGAYTAGILTYFYRCPYPLALLAGALSAAAAGLVIGYPTLRAKLRSDYFAIATLGFGEAVRVLLENLSITQGARGLPGIAHYTSLPVAAASAALVLLMARNLLQSHFGREAVAVREDHVAAEIMGVDVMRARMRSLLFSAAAAGFSGGLFAHYFNFIQPAMFTSVLSTQLTAAVVCGGMGSLTGPALATAIFVGIPELLRVASMWRLVAYGALLVAIMVFRPQGLLGYRELSWKALGRRRRPARPERCAAGRHAAESGSPQVPTDIPLSVGGQPGSREFISRSALPAHGGGPHQPVAADPVLKLTGVTKRFGGVVACDRLNMELGRGEILGLIGPNGAGKTTVFNLITGVYPVLEGEISFEGRSIKRLRPDRIARAGIARTFQNVRLFKNLSVLDNVLMPVGHPPGYSLLDALLRTPRCLRREAELRQRALELLAQVGLEGYAGQRSDSLPYGLQRRLEIARALALRPRVLLLDEPAAGMNPEESRNLVDTVRSIHRSFGLSIVLIEHHMDVVTELCDRIIVLNFGALLAEGTPGAIQQNPLVLKAYLGEAGARAGS
jgi:branched-chain amino acid transport system permease protein